MLDELGTTIGAYLGQVLPAGTSVRQAPPSDTWKDQDSGIVSLFLHRVQASGGDGSAGLWTEERAPDGRVVSRTSPEQRYDFCYLVTAWSTDSELEFGLLGAILRAVANAPLVPAEHLTGSLKQARGAVTLYIGRPGLPPVQPELWSALGLSPRVSLDLVATAPVPAVVQANLSRPPETIDLGVAGPPASSGLGTTNPAGRGSGAVGNQRRPTARITEGALDGQARGEAG